MLMNKKKYVFDGVRILFLLTIIVLRGNSQIMIEGREERKIYNSITNNIELTSIENCENLYIEIEEFKEPIIPVDCKFSINHLKKDTSKMWIKNTNDEILYEIKLERIQLEAKSYININNKMMIGGQISKEELSKINGVEIAYNCPWIKSKIRKYQLTILEDNGKSATYEVLGEKIPDKIKYEITILKNPKAIYIDNIDWKPITCFEKMNSILLEID